MVSYQVLQHNGLSLIIGKIVYYSIWVALPLVLVLLGGKY